MRARRRGAGFSLLSLDATLSCGPVDGAPAPYIRSLYVRGGTENGALHGYEIARRIEHETRGALRFTLAALYPTAFPVGLLMEWVTGWPADFTDVAGVFLKAPVGSLLVPAAALLLGGVPVELFRSRRVTPHKSAVS